MKYLVPTNFSKESEAALNLATSLAITHGAEMHILHCQECDSTTFSRLDSISPKPNYNKDRIASAAVKLRNMRYGLEQKGIRCYVYNELENYEQCMVQLSDTLEPDLIIIGAKGYERTSDWIFSSTSKNVAKMIRHRTIIIDEAIEEIHFDKVLFVLDDCTVSPSETLTSIEWLSTMGMRKLEILCSAQCEQLSNSLAHTINKNFASVTCTTEIIADDHNFEPAVYKKIKENSYYLVAIKTSYKPTFFSQINIHDILSNSTQTALLAL